PRAKSDALRSGGTEGPGPRAGPLPDHRGEVGDRLAGSLRDHCTRSDRSGHARGVHCETGDAAVSPGAATGDSFGRRCDLVSGAWLRVKILGAHRWMYHQVKTLCRFRGYSGGEGRKYLGENTWGGLG